MPFRLGRRSPHPLSSSKPAGEQRGGEQPGRRSLEGVGGVLGSRGKNFSLFFSSIQEVYFYSLVSQGLAGLSSAQAPVFGRVEREEIFEEK